MRNALKTGSCKRGLTRIQACYRQDRRIVLSEGRDIVRQRAQVAVESCVECFVQCREIGVTIKIAQSGHSPNVIGRSIGINAGERAIKNSAESLQ